MDFPNVKVIDVILLIPYKYMKSFYESEATACYYISAHRHGFGCLGIVRHAQGSMPRCQSLLLSGEFRTPDCRKLGPKHKVAVAENQ
jgi:hypothetical protein